MEKEQENLALPEGYEPSEKEAFMNERQKVYFKKKLIQWREELLKEALETFHHLQNDTTLEADPADRASLEESWTRELRTRDRERKLLVKIEDAIERIDNGTYGYCEKTGEPIGLKRLSVRPIATLSIDAQEQHEREEKVGRDH
eukprot:g8359.t1